MKFERMRFRAPGEKRNWLIAFLVFIFIVVLAFIYYERSLSKTDAERRFMPSPVAPLGPEKKEK